MWRGVCQAIDNYRIWYKITYQRGRVLFTPPEAWRRYAARPPFASAESFFPVDGSIPPVQVTEQPAPPGVRISRIEFATLHPLPFAETNQAVGHLYTPVIRPEAPVVVLSHGWAHRDRRGIARLYVRPLLRRGLSVLLMAHPLHFERTPRGAYSGELMVSGDAELTVEAFRQAVADTGAAVNYLRSIGRERWGVFGYSLGGYVAGLLACVRSDASFLVMAGCGDSILSPILDTPLGRNVREDLSQSDLLDQEKLGVFWGTVSPASWRPRLPRERIL